MNDNVVPFPRLRHPGPDSPAWCWRHLGDDTWQPLVMDGDADFVRRTLEAKTGEPIEVLPWSERCWRKRWTDSDRWTVFFMPGPISEVIKTWAGVDGRTVIVEPIPDAFHPGNLPA